MGENCIDFYNACYFVEYSIRMYVLQWADGPTVLSDVDHACLKEEGRISYAGVSVDCSDGGIDELIASSKKRRYLLAKYYLLERESQNKRPPKWRYNNYRATFDIPFESEQYKQWVSKTEQIKRFKFGFTFS